MWSNAAKNDNHIKTLHREIATQSPCATFLYGYRGVSGVVQSILVRSLSTLVRPELQVGNQAQADRVALKSVGKVAQELARSPELADKAALKLAGRGRDRDKA